MSQDQTRINLGNMASNLKHIAMFLADDKWQLKLPRIKKFLEVTKVVYFQTKIDKKSNLFKFFENYLNKETINNKDFAEESLYFSVRFQNLAKII